MMTFDQGALVVISTLGGVVSLLFALVQKATNARISSQAKQITGLQMEVDECKSDREELWRTMRDLPNPKFCTIPNCPLRPNAPTQMTFSTQPADTAKPKNA